ncbi:hypothetical protein [Microbacterium sp.]|uniref:hypothetical protein n=1 Tax=Microbacterium sp. TaxID=51671 RepID=UPI00391C03BB
MAYLIALGILTLAGVVATLWLVRTDGYGRVPTDPARVTAAVPDVPRSPVTAAPSAEAARPSVHVAAPLSSPITAPLRIAGTD